MKPRIAVFSLTGCEGCSLAILELEDQLLELLDAVDVVNFREAMTERDWDIDIGFVDGAVSTPSDEEEVKHFRAKCTTLVAIGACACLGGINTLKNRQEAENYRQYVYGDRYRWFPTTDARPVSAVVKVDFELPGCPIDRYEFLRLVGRALAGRMFHLPDYPVCVECKKRGNLCLYAKGIMCLGPLTRAGCSAICPTFGAKCEGCRGILGPDSLKAAAINFPDHYGVAIDDVLHDLRLYGAHQGGTLP